MAETPTPRDVRQMQEKTQENRVETALSGLKVENFRLTEALENIQLMLDERGYQPLFDYQSNGLSLYQAQMASRQLRELVVGNPTMKRGSELRNDLIWGKGVDFDFTGMSPLAEKKLWAIINSPSNQRVLFGHDAQTELERAAYTDGNIFHLGENSSKRLTRIPLAQITGAYSDPDDHENVMAIRRSWVRKIDSGIEEKNVWFYLDTYDAERALNITFKGVHEEVDTTQTMFWTGYNKQVGWVWGIPDALPAIAWSKLWKDFLVQGSVMSKALAQIAYKLTAKTSDGMNKMTAAVRDDDGSGRAIGLMDTMDIAPLASAGKGYDFASGEELGAMVAAGLGLTDEEVLAKPNTDKADGVPASTKRSMRSRQATQGEMLKRVLVWMGAKFDSVDIDFPEIDDVDSFRRQQSLSSALGTGLFAPEEIRPEMAEVVGIDLLSDKVPDGFMIPNNLKSLQAGAQVTNVASDGSTTTTTNDGSGNAGAPKADGSNSMANGQGRNNTKQGTQSAGNNDLRDGIKK